ncbi:hypothetical protein ACFW24_26235 [Streptomyces nigra]|uniref:hypothetical protein n=1 Tax=Streptomyces nigra TaxID=1827580 RepID=UPI00369C0141
MKRRAHIPRSSLHFRKIAAVSVALCAALALTACSSSDGKKDAEVSESPRVTQSPTASATADAKDAVKRQAIATYKAYWREMEKLYGDRSGKSARLDQYAAAAALMNAEADAKRSHDRGNINTGSVALTDQVITEVKVTGKIPNATVSSCLDISKWQTVDAETKKPVSLPENRLTKYRILSIVEKYPEGWRVTSDEPQGKSC